MCTFVRARRARPPDRFYRIWQNGCNGRQARLNTRNRRPRQGRDIPGKSADELLFQRVPLVFHPKKIVCFVEHQQPVQFGIGGNGTNALPLGYDRFRQFFALFAEFDEIARAVAVIPTVVGVRTRDLRDRVPSADATTLLCGMRERRIPPVSKSASAKIAETSMVTNAFLLHFIASPPSDDRAGTGLFPKFFAPIHAFAQFIVSRAHRFVPGLLEIRDRIRRRIVFSRLV